MPHLSMESQSMHGEHLADIHSCRFRSINPVVCRMDARTLFMFLILVFCTLLFHREIQGASFTKVTRRSATKAWQANMQ